MKVLNRTVPRGCFWNSQDQGQVGGFSCELQGQERQEHEEYPLQVPLEHYNIW